MFDIMSPIHPAMGWQDNPSSTDKRHSHVCLSCCGITDKDNLGRFSDSRGKLKEIKEVFVMPELLNRTI